MRPPSPGDHQRDSLAGVSEPLRVVIGEDDVLLREGIARLLAEAGFEVVAQAGDADDFLRKALAHRPDVAVVDVRMPPDRDDDGLRAALELRKRQRPETGVLVLSQYYEEHYALDLIGERPQGSATCSRSASATSRRSSTRSSAWPQAAARSTPRWSARMLGRRRERQPARPAEPARARRARRDGGGKVEPRDRRVALRHRGRGREARDEHLPQARARRRRRSTAGCSPC